jgi:hypothetical protein
MISRQGFFALAVFSAVSFLAAGHAGAADNVWTPVGPPGGIVTGLAFDGGTANLAYAATTGGFFRSTDGGASWAASNGGLRDAHLQRLVTMGAVVYVGGFDGVSRSDDRGLQFRRLASAPTSVTALAIGVGANPPLFAAGIFSGAWRSDDGGATWKEINAAGGVQRSRDGGVTWETVLPGAATLVSVDPRAPNTVYAAPGSPAGYSTPPPQEPLVSVSDDAGATWTPLAPGLPPNVPVVDLAFDAASPALLYAATAGGGVFTLQRVP